MMVATRGLVVLTTCLTLAGCGLLSSSPETAGRATAADVPLVMLTPLGGTDSTAAKHAAQGAQLAVDLVNDDYADIALPLAKGSGLPGLGGARVRLTVMDSRTTSPSPVDAVAATRPAGVLLADEDATVSMLSPQLERLRVPVVDALSDADELTDTGLDWYFRTSPPQRVLVSEAFAMLRHQQAAGAQVRRIMIVQGVAGLATDVVLTIREMAAGAGYDMLNVTVDPDRPNPTSVADKVAASRPDVVFAVVGNSTEAAAMGAAAARMRSEVPLVVVGHAPAALVGQAGAAADLFRPAAWSHEYAARNPLAQRLADVYQRRFGSQMNDAAAAGFTAAWTLLLAVDRGHSAEPSQVRASLRQMRVPATQMIMPWDGVRFGSTGQNELAGGVVEQRSPDGFKVVHPRELATIPVAGWPGAAPPV